MVMPHHLHSQNKHTLLPLPYPLSSTSLKQSHATEGMACDVSEYHPLTKVDSCK